MKTKLYLFLAIAFISLIVFSGSWGLTDSSEARYAQISKEIFISNDYINPTLLGIKHLHKPPVTYYLTALGYQLFGINEFGARFFMQLALIFQLLLVYKITLLLYKNEKLAFTAALIYFSFPITVVAVRSLTTDAYLTTFILASIYFWLNYQKQSKPYLLYLFYLFLGLIFETKGPVGFIIPVTFIITHKIVYKNKIEVTIHQFFGFLLFLLISASWYIVAIKNNEGLLDYFLNNQLIDRVTQNKFKRDKPFWLYFVLMPLVGFPWLFYFLPYFKKNLKIFFNERKTAIVLLSSFSVLFLILSISTSKLILYALPLYFILAIFSAKYLSNCSKKRIQLFSTIYVSLLIFILLFIVIASFLNTGFQINSIYASIILVFFGSIGLYFNKKFKNDNYLKPAYLGVIFIISIIFTSNHLFADNESKLRSVKPIAKLIEEKSVGKPTVLVYNYLLPSLLFYLEEEIITINHGRYTTQREIQFETNENWKEHLINYFDKKDRARILDFNSKKDVFFIKRITDTIPDTLQTFTNKLKYKKAFDKFEVYY